MSKPCAGREGPKLRHYLFMHATFVVYSFVGLLSKTAAGKGYFTPGFYFFSFLVLCVLGVYALLWQQVLRHFPLVKAYSSKGVVVLWNLLWAALFMGEAVSLRNLIGGAVIVCGIAVVSGDA